MAFKVVRTQRGGGAVGGRMCVATLPHCSVRKAAAKAFSLSPPPPFSFSLCNSNHCSLSVVIPGWRPPLRLEQTFSATQHTPRAPEHYYSKYPQQHDNHKDGDTDSQRQVNTTTRKRQLQHGHDTLQQHAADQSDLPVAHTHT